MKAIGAPSRDIGSQGTIHVLGFRMNPMTGEEVIAEIAAAIGKRHRLVMANLNFHAMALMYQSEAMVRLLSQPDSRVMIDSMPLLMLANLLGHRLPREKRTTSLDFYDEMFRRGIDRGWRFAYVGGTAETLTRGLAELRRRFPGLAIEGRQGYFDQTDETPGSHQAEIVAWLDAAAHDIVIVGMGMPRQEEWIVRVQDRVRSLVFLPTGGYLDYQIGLQRRAPRWMGQLGLEWAYRLISSPRRLSYRYLVEPLLLLARLTARPHPQAGLQGDER